MLPLVHLVCEKMAFQEHMKTAASQPSPAVTAHGCKISFEVHQVLQLPKEVKMVL